jgi:hypothetical protein
MLILENKKIKTTGTKTLRRVYFYNKELTSLLEQNYALFDNDLLNQNVAIKAELINRNEFKMTAEQAELYTRIGRNWAKAEWEDMEEADRLEYYQNHVEPFVN